MASPLERSDPSQSHQNYSHSEDPTIRSALATKEAGVSALRQEAFRRRQSLKQKRQILRDERSAVGALEARFTKLISGPLMQNSAIDKASIESLHLELVRRREGLGELMDNYDQAERDYNEIELEFQEAEEKVESLIEDALPRLRHERMPMNSNRTYHQEANEATQGVPLNPGLDPHSNGNTAPSSDVYANILAGLILEEY